VRQDHRAEQDQIGIDFLEAAEFDDDLIVAGDGTDAASQGVAGGLVNGKREK